jgi:NAD+ kinase
MLVYTFGIFTNRLKDSYFSMTNSFVDILLRNDCVVVLPSRLKPYVLQIDSVVFMDDDVNIVEASNFVVCLGGDGTFLEISRLVFGTSKPVFGIHLGNLGFLTEVSPDSMDAAVNRILLGEYKIEDRFVLEVRVFKDDCCLLTDFALNDIVLSAQQKPTLLHINAFIDDTFVEYIPGDGVIVATPTGSTAYSLSCGGPLVEPAMDMFLITPICAHTLHSRSFIAAPDRLVSLELDSANRMYGILSVDGKSHTSITPEHRIQIKRADFRAQILRFDPQNFFDVLQRKIYDRGEHLRNYETGKTSGNH